MMPNLIQNLAAKMFQRLPTPQAILASLQRPVPNQVPQGPSIAEGLVRNFVYDPGGETPILPQSFLSPKHPLRVDYTKEENRKNMAPLAMMLTSPVAKGGSKALLAAEKAQSVSKQLGGEGGAFIDASGRITQVPTSHARVAADTLGIKNPKATQDVITPLLKKGYMRTDPTATSFNVEIHGPLSGITEPQLKHIAEQAGNRKIYIDTSEGLREFKNTIDLTTFLHGNPVVANKSAVDVGNEFNKIKGELQKLLDNGKSTTLVGNDQLKALRMAGNPQLESGGIGNKILAGLGIGAGVAGVGAGIATQIPAVKNKLIEQLMGNQTPPPGVPATPPTTPQQPTAGFGNVMVKQSPLPIEEQLYLARDPLEVRQSLTPEEAQKHNTYPVGVDIQTRANYADEFIAKAPDPQAKHDLIVQEYPELKYYLKNPQTGKKYYEEHPDEKPRNYNSYLKLTDEINKTPVKSVEDMGKLKKRVEIFYSNENEMDVPMTQKQKDTVEQLRADLLAQTAYTPDVVDIIKRTPIVVDNSLSINGAHGFTNGGYIVLSPQLLNPQRAARAVTTLRHEILHTLDPYGGDATGNPEWEREGKDPDNPKPTKFTASGDPKVGEENKHIVSLFSNFVKNPYMSDKMLPLKGSNDFTQEFLKLPEDVRKNLPRGFEDYIARNPSQLAGYPGSNIEQFAYLGMGGQKIFTKPELKALHKYFEWIYENREVPLPTKPPVFPSPEYLEAHPEMVIHPEGSTKYYNDLYIPNPDEFYKQNPDIQRPTGFGKLLPKK